MAALTTPFSGLGTTLGVKSGSSTSYTNLVQLMDDAGFSGFETTVIDLPLLGVVSLQKAPGRIDPGQFTASLYWVPADTGVQAVLAMYQARSVNMWQVQLPDGAMGVGGTTGSTVTFSGFISECSFNNLSGDDAPHVELTIEVIGSPTFTIGT